MGEIRIEYMSQYPADAPADLQCVSQDPAKAYAVNAMPVKSQRNSFSPEDRDIVLAEGYIPQRTIGRYLSRCS
jgi:hypothetical protein